MREMLRQAWELWEGLGEHPTTDARSECLRTLAERGLPVHPGGLTLNSLEFRGVLIGSAAACAQIEWRRPKDIDLVGTVDDLRALNASGAVRHAFPMGPHKFRLRFYDGKSGEFEFVEAVESAAYLYAMDHALEVDVGGVRARVAGLDVLLALKEAHRHLNIHWHKTQRDWHRLAPLTGKRSNEVAEFLRLRRCEAEARSLLGSKKRRKVKFGVPVKMFFTQHAVNRFVEHDRLHELVAQGTPAFKEFLKDDGTAAFDMNKWRRASLDRQLASAREEIAVLALERGMLTGKTDNINFAWDGAYQALATRLSSGNFQQFLFNHYPILSILDENFGYYLTALCANILSGSVH